MPSLQIEDFESLRVQMYIPSFAELLGDEQLFFAEHFGRTALLRRGALLADPRELLSVADLDELLHHEAIRMPYVTVAKDGLSTLEASYRRSLIVGGSGETVTDAIEPEHVYEHFRAGKSIVWSSLHHFRSNLRSLCIALGEKFSTVSGVQAFLTPAGRQGYSPHRDQLDVFVIQLEGTKHWSVWATPSTKETATATHYRLEELGEPLLDVTLEPGDVLYIPFGTPHVAVAGSQTSLHLSVTVQPRTWADMMRVMVNEILNSEKELQDFPFTAGDRITEHTETLRQNINLLMARLASIDPSETLHHIADLSHLKGVSRRGSTFQDIAAIDKTTPGTIVVRTNASLSIGGIDHDNKVTLIINGTLTSRSGAISATTLKVPAPVASSLRQLGENGTIRAGDLYPDVPADRSVEVTKSLARIGILRLAP